VRGQRLFIRPIENDDAEALDDFLATQGRARRRPRSGLLGKLVGDLAAVLIIEITDDAVRVEELVVAHELRRKRIGRFMLDELAKMAGKLDRERLTVEAPEETRAFFRRVGFEGDGAVMVRRVIR
jgi:GNAT superfamily N-acetyltransferase